MLVMSTTTSPTTTFDAAALKRAIENRDAEALLGLYADDAVVEVADHEHPPAAPSRAAGKDALRAVFADVYGRDMTHRVGPIAVDGESVGYIVRCAYPDGTRVLCSAVAELRDGRIARETGVQAWDS
jgi:ketosteroid isomerase-like protein